MKSLLSSVFVVALLLTAACASSPTSSKSDSCFTNPTAQQVASSRLLMLAAEDQTDRQGEIDWKTVTPRDIQRRIEVAGLFARGCLATAADYGAAATVFQHGDTADHAYQAFVWSKRGVDLGDEKQKWWMAAAADRYLVRIGQKQLFATQFSKNDSDPCWCMEPVEESFSDSKRAEFTKKTLAKSLEFLKDLNKNAPSCAATRSCTAPRKPSPMGTLPGFW